MLAIPIAAILIGQAAAHLDLGGDWESVGMRYTKLHIISLGSDRYSIASHCEECFGSRNDRHFARLKDGVLKLDGPLEEDTEYDTDTFVVKVLPAGVFLVRKTQLDSWPDDVRRLALKDHSDRAFIFAHAFTRPGVRTGALR